MNKNIKKTIYALVALVVLVLYCVSVKAAEDDLPTPHSQSSYGSIRKTSLSATENGYMRVYYDESKICIEYYDYDFNLLDKKTVEMELAYWGGFYEGKDNYYVVVGQDNDEENDALEVIRIVKYDKNWNRIGAAGITGNTQLFGGGVTSVFDHGHVGVTERNGTLYLATGHGGYTWSDGKRHQGLILIAVDIESMTGKIIRSDLSHSFAQCMDSDDNYIYLSELSDVSNGILLTKFEGSGIDIKTKSIIKAFKFPDISTATLEDMAVSANNVICIGSSIDQTKYGNGERLPYNLFLTVTPKNSFDEESTTIKWITDYKDGENGYSFKDVHITKINDNKFMIAWSRVGIGEGLTSADYNDPLSSSYLHYIFIDGNGNIISKEFTSLTANLTDCKPVLNGHQIAYYGSDDMNVVFYTINTDTNETNRKVHRVVGKNAEWKIDENTLFISGKGKVEYTSLFWPYDIQNDIKIIVFEDGITEIPEHAFSYYKNLKEVYIPDSVIQIGKNAFYLDSYIKSHYNITIYGNYNTYAEQYANSNYMTFKSLSDYKPVPIQTSGIYCASTSPSIIAGMVVDNKSEITKDIEYQWLVCDESTGAWSVASDWTKNNEWMNYTPSKSGNYIFLCKARIVGESNSEVSASFGTPFTKTGGIKQICQMPYWGEGGGYLIGFESFENPNQEYQYEMFVMDLSLLAAGSPTPWVHATGKIKLAAGATPEDGKTMWTIWQPEYGYYLTLFRLYDKNGEMIDEVPYGFANAY